MLPRRWKGIPRVTSGHGHGKRVAIAGARAWSLALLLGLPIGCAATNPVREDALAVARRQYPAPRYLVAEGVSESGFAEAEFRARAAVAAQMSSQLSAVLTSTARSSTQGRVHIESEQLESAITTRTTFTHAELIRLDANSRRMQKGRYFVLAWLDRAELAGPLERDYESRATAFRTLAAVLLAPDSPAAGWVALQARADSAFAGLQAVARAVGAITQAEHAPLRGDRVLVERIESTRRARLQGTPVVLEWTGEPDVRAMWAAPAVEALGALGVRTSERCIPGSLRLVLSPDVRCEPGALGPVCRLVLPGTLSRCADEGVLGEFALVGIAAPGADTRDPARARARLLAALQRGRLRSEFARILAPYLPL